jgi:hypothetical protein
MRTIFVFAIALSAVVGLLSSDGAEPTTPPSSPPVAPPTYIPGERQSPQYNHDQVQWLRQEYVAMAKKRADVMDGVELQEGVTEMRRQWLIGELTQLNNHQNDARVAVAAMALKAKDEKELFKLIGSMAKELPPEPADTKP